MDDDIELFTERLALRRWRPSDEAPMAAINRDPEVTRYLNRPVDDAATRSFLDASRDHWSLHGFGHLAVESREEATSGELLGFVGVAYPGFLPEVAHRPELGWRLRRSAWGRGLATEAATAARDDAWATLDLPGLISIIHPDNERSRAVARKLGMSVEGTVHNPVLDRHVEIWAVAAT